MPHKIAQVLDELSRELGIGIITPEFEILLALLEAGSLTSDQLAEQSSLSRSGFFHVLDRLKHRNFVECSPGMADRRSKTYRLQPRTAQVLLANLANVRASQLTFNVLSLRHGDGAGNILSLNEVDGQGREFRLPHLTCEYQILLYLYFTPGASNSDIARAVSVSETRYQAGLQTLIGLGLVAFAPDGKDRRRKCYHAVERVVKAIDRSNRASLKWVQEIQLRYPGSAQAHERAERSGGAGEDGRGALARPG